MNTILTVPEIEHTLATLPVEWSVIGGTQLVREYAVSSFSDALVFLSRVEQVAVQQDKYPHVVVSPHSVVLTITTNELSGLTKADFTFAVLLKEAEA